MKLRRSMWLLAWAGVCLAAVGCEDERPEPSLNQFVPPGNDAGQDAGDDTVADERPEPLELPPAEDICEAGQVRCLSTGQQQIEVCAVPEGASVEVTRWVPGLCPEGQTCQRNACAPLECIPEQPTCDGQGALGICGADGASVVEAQPCPGDSVCRRGVCIDLCEAAAADRSYIGCQYMVVDLPNPFDTEGSRGSPFGLVVANPEGLLDVTLRLERPDGTPEVVLAEATVTPTELATPARPVTVRSSIRDARGEVVATPSGPADEVVVPPGGVATLLLARQRLPHTSSGVFAQGRRLIASRPVVAYQYNPYCCNFSFTNDASLLYPIATLGNEYRFLGVPSWASVDDGNGASRIPATLTIVGVRTDTEVLVELPPGASIQPPRNAAVTVNGQQVTATLQPNDVLHLMSALPNSQPGVPIRGVDLSGARITANQPISVFSGHMCTYFPQEFGACDHLEEQLFPVDTWGQEFALVPAFIRARNPGAALEATWWKIIARDDNTRIALSAPYNSLGPREPGFDGVPDCADHLVDDRTIELDAGQFCEFGTQSPVTANATGPLMVMGIISGQDTTGVFQAFGAHAGDPAIFLVPPQRQYRNSYAFLAPTTYFNDYLTVITEPGNQLLLDGQPVDMTNATPIPGSTQVYRHLVISDGPHNVTGSQPFGIMAFAFDDYVSYAFTGGLNLFKGGR